MPRKPAVTFDTVRDMGLAIPGVEAGTTYGTFSLKVRGKMIACRAIHKSAEPNSLWVVMDFDERDELIAADPETYYLRAHYASYRGVLVPLSRVHPDALRDLLVAAARFVSRKGYRSRPQRRRPRRQGPSLAS